VTSLASRAEFGVLVPLSAPPRNRGPAHPACRAKIWCTPFFRPGPSHSSSRPSAPEPVQHCRSSGCALVEENGADSQNPVHGQRRSAGRAAQCRVAADIMIVPRIRQEGHIAERASRRRRTHTAGTTAARGSRSTAPRGRVGIVTVPRVALEPSPCSSLGLPLTPISHRGDSGGAQAEERSAEGPRLYHDCAKVRAGADSVQQSGVTAEEAPVHFGQAQGLSRG